MLGQHGFHFDDHSYSSGFERLLDRVRVHLGFAHCYLGFAHCQTLIAIFMQGPNDIIPKHFLNVSSLRASISFVVIVSVCEDIGIPIVKRIWVISFLSSHLTSHILLALTGFF